MNRVSRKSEREVSALKYMYNLLKVYLIDIHNDEYTLFFVFLYFQLLISWLT